MPTPSDFLTGLPLTGDANKAQTRAALVKRVIYPFADAENPADFVALVNGSVPLGLARGLVGAIFFLDPLDSSTAHDGVTCIVTSDGYRYKSSNTTMPDSVKGLDQDDAPEDAVIGDAYVTSAAPDGEFAENPLEIALLTQRGWVFIPLKVGRPLYVEGSGHYYLDENGDILRTSDAPTNAVRDGALVGGQRRYIVENKTTNDPPASPGDGVYWIVGPSPTGAWAGYANYIATKYDGDANWTLIEPKTGDEAYIRSPDGTNFIWDGAAWVSAAGAWNKIHYIKTASGSTTAPSGTTGWNFTGLPTTSQRRIIDTAILSVQAPLGKLLRFSYRANATISATSSGSQQGLYFGVALFRDSDATAIAVRKFGAGLMLGSPTQTFFQTEDMIQRDFLIVTDDALSHDYRIAIMSLNMISTSFSDITALALREFMCEVAG